MHVIGQYEKNCQLTTTSTLWSLKQQQVFLQLTKAHVKDNCSLPLGKPKLEHIFRTLLSVKTAQSVHILLPVRIGLTMLRSTQKGHILLKGMILLWLDQCVGFVYCPFIRSTNPHTHLLPSPFNRSTECLLQGDTGYRCNVLQGKARWHVQWNLYPHHEVTSTTRFVQHTILPCENTHRVSSHEHQLTFK